MKKITFVFSGKRLQLMNDIKEHRAPDTQLYGMNHISSNYEVGYKEFGEKGISKFFSRFIGFRMRHILTFFTLGKTDIVFGPSIYFMLPLKKLFHSKAKYVLFNISLNRFIKENYKKPIIGKVVRYLIGSLDMVVSLSNMQNDELKSYIDPKKLAFIPLGVDARYYEPKYEGRANTILSVGRDNGRDYKTVIEAARDLPLWKFELVLSSRNIKGIENIPNNVKVLFDISKAELKEKYQSCGLLLLLTHSDGYKHGSDCSGQTVLLDAFASGLPVLASRKAWIEDYAKENEHLLLVPPYDKKSVVEAILSKKWQNKDMAKKARQLVDDKFSTTIMGQKLEDLFNKI